MVQHIACRAAGCGGACCRLVDAAAGSFASGNPHWRRPPRLSHRYPQRHRLQLRLELEELVDGVAVAHQALGHHLDRVLER